MLTGRPLAEVQRFNARRRLSPSMENLCIPGRALRASQTGREPGIRAADSHHARARHRREYGDVQRPQRGDPRPLAYPEPDKLISSPVSSPAWLQPVLVSSPNSRFQDWNRAFSSWCLLGAGRKSRSRAAGQPVTALVTSGDAHAGCPAAPGRVFTLATRAAPGTSPSSLTAWRSGFGADRDPRQDPQNRRPTDPDRRSDAAGYDVHGQKVELWLPLTLDRTLRAIRAALPA